MLLAAACLASSLLSAMLVPALAAPLADALAGAPPSPAALALALADLPSPAEALAWWASGAALADLPGALLAALLCSIACFALALAASADPRRAEGGTLGRARLRRGREALRGSDLWDGRSEPAGAGYVYGFQAGRYLYESRSPHALVVGSTGSGKTRYQVIPTLDLLTFGEGGRNVVVSDVKGELLELCGEALRRRGYRVLLLDVQRPARGNRYNPLSLVCSLASSGDAQGAEQAAEDLAAALVPREADGSSAHWADSARGLVASCALAVALDPDCPPACRHMASVCRLLDEGTQGAGADPTEPLRAYLRGLPQGHSARSFASQFLSSSGDEMHSILSTAKLRLRPFASGSIAWMTSGDEVDPGRILRQKTALFLHVLDEGSPYNALFCAFFDQLYRAAHALADGCGSRLPRETVILGDEWGNLPPVASLPSLLSLGRSYGLRWFGAVQNLAQLNRHGREDGRPKILANCGVKVALRLGEREDREYFTELVGKTTRRPGGAGRTRGASSSATSSYSESADDVVRPWEWTEASPSREGATVVKQAEIGAPASHAGSFRVPLRDCALTPTGAHFGLGSREQEARKRAAFQAFLDERAARAASAEAPTWAPAWPAAGERARGGGEADEWSAYDRR